MLKLIALLGAMTALTSCSDESRFFPRQDFCCEERRFFPRRVFEEVWLQLEWGLYQCRLWLQ